MLPSYLGWLRQFVGHQKVISTGAAAIIRDERGRVLLQKRSDVGLWGIPGGGQELGERIDETLRREVREEMGLEIEPKHIIDLYTLPRVLAFPNGDQVQPCVVRFECEIVGGALKGDGVEVLDVGWFDPEHLPAMTLGARDALENVARFKGEALFDRDQNHGDSTINYYDWLRQYVGHAKIILPGAAGLIRDAQGCVLLQRRRDNGLWGFPGGLMELGESATDTVRREFNEEMGLEIEPERLIGVYTSPEFDHIYPNGDQVQLFISFFECKTVGGELRLQEEEVLESGWFDLAKLPPMIPCCAAKARDAQIFKGKAFWR